MNPPTMSFKITTINNCPRRSTSTNFFILTYSCVFPTPLVSASTRLQLSRASHIYTSTQSSREPTHFGFRLQKKIQNSLSNALNTLIIKRKSRVLQPTDPVVSRDLARLFTSNSSSQNQQPPSNVQFLVQRRRLPRPRTARRQ